MKKPVHTVPSNFTIEEAAAILLEKKISGLPVVNDAGELVGIITRSDIFHLIISLTGMGKKGIQFALRIKDMPGPIKEVRELIHEYKGRTASIMTSGENAPDGYLNIYFRVYNIDRKELPALMEEIEKKGRMLYVVDHREGNRTIYEG